MGTLLEHDHAIIAFHFAFHTDKADMSLLIRGGTVDRVADARGRVLSALQKARSKSLLIAT